VTAERGAEDLDRRRAAMTALGEQVRELGLAVVATEVPEDRLVEAARVLREVTALLGDSVRGSDEPAASVDDLARGVRLFNPVSGPASPIAPPLRVEEGPGGLVGGARLDLVHEGHPGYAHGGIVAALLDDILGQVASRHASPVVTSRLTIRYRKPVPLRVPLLVTGAVAATDGARMTLRGVVSTRSEAEVVLAEAEGWFVHLSPAQITGLFGSDGVRRSR
jgi:acyl-coenzyme A thioesterase PaaI-like protein